MVGASSVKWRVVRLEAGKSKRDLRPTLESLKLTMKAKWKMITQLILGATGSDSHFGKISLAILCGMYEEMKMTKHLVLGAQVCGSNLKKEESDPRLK